MNRYENKMNEINIIYNIDNKTKIRLFGSEFIKKNKKIKLKNNKKKFR